MNTAGCWVFATRTTSDSRPGSSWGSGVFVCDNLAFSGEIQVARRHTTNIQRDLPRLVNTAVAQLVEKWTSQDNRIAAYKQLTLTDEEVHDIAIRSVDLNVFPITMVPKLLSEWREPTYEEFEPRTGWSLFNAYTQVLKDAGSLALLPKRTMALHGLFDGRAGLASGVN
jgi:hypothetical protein